MINFLIIEFEFFGLAIAILFIISTFSSFIVAFGILYIHIPIRTNIPNNIDSRIIQTTHILIIVILYLMYNKNNH